MGTATAQQPESKIEETTEYINIKQQRPSLSSLSLYLSLEALTSLEAEHIDLSK
jgi:hypothetical protein